MLTCATCGKESPESFRYCPACAAPFADDAPVAREERKVVTVVFADLVGSTARAERLDPEDVRTLLSTYHARVRHELEGHGGTVEKFIGDAVVAVFGAPVSHEDDPERAVRAALAIQESIAELNEDDPDLDLEVRIGVNTGEALVVLEARTEAGEGMVSGDVINTAARLQSAAPPGGILVGEQTHRATERAIEYAGHEPVQARGKAEPVVAWLALARRASFGIEHGVVGRAPLVGRQREVALLADALTRVRSDERPQLITLVGVPGIGKSRLVHELSEIVDADTDLITWRRGRSLPYGEGVAYWALGEIIKAQAGILESDGADVASEKLGAAVVALVPDRTECAWVERQLRPLIGLHSGESQPSRGEAFAARRRFLEALAEQRPTVIVFEDLHWADDDLLDFIDELTHRLDAVPLLLVCTARPELLTRRPGWGGGKPDALTLSLQPLSDEETARLLQALLDRSVLPAETQTALIQRAAGVPLFAEEYARMLESGETGTELPETLQGIVSARIDGLPPTDKALLQDASVLGRVFWTDALSTLAGIEPPGLDDRLRLLERQEFIRRERRSAVEGARQYVFLHAIVRDVAYGQIPRTARCDKHRRTAKWIAALPTDRAEDRAEMLAFHLESAIEYGEAAGIGIDDLRPLAVAALRDAGDRAWSLNIVDRAANLYRRAMDAAPGAVDAELRFLYARALMWAEGVSAPVDDLRESIDGLLAAGRNELAALAMVLLERRLWNNGTRDLALLERALELVSDTGPTPDRGRVIGQVAVRLSISGRTEEALPLAEEAVAIAEAHSDRAAEAEALNNLAVAQLNVGDLETGILTGRRALELALECGASDAPRCYVNVAVQEFDSGNIAAAARHHRDGLALATRLGNLAFVDWLAAEIVVDDHILGAWDDALREAKALVGAREEHGTSHYMDSQLRLVESSITLSRDGRLPAGLVEHALEAAHAVGDPQMLLPSLADAARLFGTVGRLAEANACLDEYVELVRDSPNDLSPGPWVINAALAWAKLRGGPIPDELVGRSPSSPWTITARSMQQGNLTAAADVLGSIGARPTEAAVRFHAADALLQADPAEASRQLELACAIWQTVGAAARLADADDFRTSLRRAAS